MNLRVLISTLLLTIVFPLWAAKKSGAPKGDCLLDTVMVVDSAQQQEAPRKLGLIRRVIRGFDRLDENYIEPQHYVFQAMVMSTYRYDFYRLSSAEIHEQNLSFGSDGNLKIGPYFGWKWVFLGYTFSLNHPNFSRDKTEFDLSIYSSQIGVDLLYRRTGNDYKIREAGLGAGIDTHPLEGVTFNGMQVGITGVNAYYIFNHGRFSYPAAFAQSTRQKISCGSWMAGLGYTRNSLKLDYDQLKEVIEERLAPQQVVLDSGLMFRSIEYNDFSISGGYAYNWVFAPKWLFCASGQVALGMKNVSTTVSGGEEGYSKLNFSPNLLGRFALVYNNSVWFAGLSAIIRSNTYRRSRFMTNNTFGTFDVYVGYNFGKKKKYRN